MRKTCKAAVSALAVIGASLAFSAPVSAASLWVDDSHPNTITIGAGEFEGGFSVNGNLLTSGLQGKGSITLPDDGGPITFYGSWIDLGEAGGLSIADLFAEPHHPGSVSSGITYETETDGYMGKITGTIYPYNAKNKHKADTYFQTTLPTQVQGGGTALSDIPYLGSGFVSEPLQYLRNKPHKKNP